MREGKFCKFSFYDTNKSSGEYSNSAKKCKNTRTADLCSASYVVIVKYTPISTTENTGDSTVLTRPSYSPNSAHAEILTVSLSSKIRRWCFRYDDTVLQIFNTESAPTYTRCQQGVCLPEAAILNFYRYYLFFLKSILVPAASREESISKYFILFSCNIQQSKTTIRSWTEAFCSTGPGHTVSTWNTAPPNATLPSRAQFSAYQEQFVESNFCTPESNWQTNTK